MPQSISHVLIHTVFSTKNRKPFLQDKDVREQTFAYLGGIAKAMDCLPLQIGGYIDHVHMLTTLSRTCSQADFVKEVKRNSSIWLKENGQKAEFQWQKGYGVFSVSESRVHQVKAYIVGQEEHHRKVTFKEEFRKLLDVHKKQYDERYIWD